MGCSFGAVSKEFASCHCFGMTDESIAPGRSPFQNGVRTSGRAFNSPNWRMKGEDSPSAQSSGSPGPKTNSSRLTFSRPSSQVPQAISEGRRLYVGNMPYTAKSEDVQALFTAANFPMYGDKNSCMEMAKTECFAASGSISR